MVRRLIPALACLAFAGCGASDGKVQKPPGTGLSLLSPAVQDGAPIAGQFTCDGANQAPPLSWSEPPAGTRSFALVLDDPDAPGGTFRHWGVYDIPAPARALPAPGAAEAINDFGKPGYGGPCPPNGHGADHYRFKLYALDVQNLALPAGAKVEEVEEAAKQHQLGLAQLMGTFERK